MNLADIFMPDATVKTVEIARNNYQMCFFEPDKFLLTDDELGQLDKIFDGIVTDADGIPGVSCGYLPPMNGHPPVYLKRRIYGPSLRVRNFFRKMAPFRRVLCMELAIQAGIPTPNLLACGHKKSYGSISSVYICMEYVNDAVPVDALFARPDARARVSLFIEDGLRLIASLHKNNFYYSEFSLNSFYYRDAVLSLWNPAWIQYTHGRNRKKYILNDLTSFGVAVMQEAIKHRPVLDDFIGFDVLAERLVLSYGEIAPGWLPSCAELTHALTKAWEKNR